MYNYRKLNFRIIQTKYYVNEILPVHDNLTKRKWSIFQKHNKLSVQLTTITFC